jgi:PAS domain S-box-containing protein
MCPSNVGKIISTHFKRPTLLTDRELRFVDLLARQAADYLERRQNDDALRDRTKRAQLVRIADSVPVLISQCSSDLHYIFVNKSYADFIGRPAESIADRPIEEVLGESVFKNIRPYIERVLAGERVQFETELTSPSIGPRRMHVVDVPDLDARGAVVGWFASIEDVTEQREAEERLREADRNKDQFIAMLAHELRNPLAAILSESEVLRSERPSSSDLEVTASVISNQAGHMARMLDDLLDVSRIARRKLELREEYLDLVKVIQSVAEATRSIVEERGHELVLTLPGAPLYVYGDRTRLEQVFVNLISNAAKSCERNGRIQLTCQRENASILVSVRDNGAGIDPDVLPRLFQMFTQAQHSNGLGIGLYLARQIAELHGGNVDAISEGLGKGAEFRVRLPLAQPPARKEQTHDIRSQEDAAPKHRVLVVDDQVGVADSLARLLKVMGQEARVAYDGAGGIELASKFKPDVILLDIGMPNLDGYDTCRQIRQQPWGKGILVAA